MLNMHRKKIYAGLMGTVESKMAGPPIFVLMALALKEPVF